MFQVSKPSRIAIAAVFCAVATMGVASVPPPAASRSAGSATVKFRTDRVPVSGSHLVMEVPSARFMRPPVAAEDRHAPDTRHAPGAAAGIASDNASDNGSGNASGFAPDAPAEDEALFWAWDFHRQQYHQVRGANVYRSAAVWIYVEHGRSVPSSAIQTLGRLFDDTIYPTLRATYGRDPYPGIDNQAAITVLMLDIRDPLYYGVDPPTYFSGYFDPTNQRHQRDLSRENPYARSNEREMVYLDIAPGDPQGVTIRQTLAHEFTHLIHWSYDPDEEEWLSEGLSELAVWVCGLGHPAGHVQAFLGDPTGTIVSWTGEPGDYGRVYLFLLYLHERAEGSSSTWLRRLVRNPDNGMRSVDTSFPVDIDIDELFRDFVLALFLDADATQGGLHGFKSLDLYGDNRSDGFTFPPGVHHAAGSFSESIELEPWGMRADLIEVRPGGAEVELRAPEHGCAGAGWRGAHVEPARTACLSSGRTVIWSFRNPDDAPRTLLVTTANPSMQRVNIELSSIESATTQSRVHPAFLPFTIRP